MGAILSPLGTMSPSLMRVAINPVNPAFVTKPSLRYDELPTGIIVYWRGLPVAWILSGYHTGQIDKQLKTCRFVDVVYRRKTNNGINLETLDCDTVEEAKAKLSHIFGGAV